ncbi:MAG: AMP-binding protein [Firmicutes bacterium]|nr:AMP-binding protein [Bacillota bacterium]
MKNYPFYACNRYDTFQAFIEGMDKLYGELPAITWYDGQGASATRTYGQMAADVYAVAEALIERGLAGKHAAVISQNSYMAVVSMLAVICGGGVAVPLDIEQDAATLKSMALFADAELLFISDVLLERAGGTGGFDGRPVVVLSDDASLAGGFGELLAEGNALLAARGRKCTGIRLDPGQTALIVYTSGTTSVSKPVMLSHRAVLANASGATELVQMPRRVYNSLPMYHVYSFTCGLLSNMVTGCEICFNGDIRFMMRDLITFKPSAMVIVPLIAEVLCKKLVDFADTVMGNKGFTAFVKKASRGAFKYDPDLVAIKEKIVPGLNLMICGGAHLSVTIAKVLYKFGISVLEGYGITECAPIISVNRNEYQKLGTVGILMPGYDIKFDGEEILVRGVCVMNGYYKQPEMTAEVLNDGWFRTGDLGYLDADGFLSITGRKKNLIVLKNGKKVSPEELEELLAGLPLAKEVMVYGSSVGNANDDVVPAVSVYPDPEATKGMSAYEILSELQKSIDAINEKLAAYKQIRLINIREKELPKTSTKKIKRTS